MLYGTREATLCLPSLQGQDCQRGPVKSSFLLVLNDSTKHLAVKRDLVVRQLLPLSPALTPSDHQL